GNARGSRPPFAAPAEPSSEPFEGAAHGGAGEAVVVVGAEEGRRSRRGAEAVTPGEAGAKRVPGAFVQGGEPRLPAFAGTDGDRAFSEVDVVAGERERLADPKPRAGEQREQRD